MLRPVEFKVTPVDQRVLDLLVNECLSAEDIGKELGISPGTVKSHLTRLYQRAGLHGSRGSKRLLLARLLRDQQGGAETTARLTEKEARVCRMVADGMGNRQIAEDMGSTEQVIKNALRLIFDKTGTWSRLELAAWYDAHRASDAASVATSSAVACA